MHNVKLSDLSLSTLRNIKKRIQFCRDNKDNSITDTFRGLDLNFFENCVDQVIILKQQGYKFVDENYKKILDGAIINDVKECKSEEVFAPLKSGEDGLIGKIYTISINKNSFINNVKFMMTKTGGFGGMSFLFIVDTEGRVYRCTSHGAYSLENIEDEIVIGKLLGNVSIPDKDYTSISCETIKRVGYVMDSVIYCFFTLNSNLEQIILFQEECGEIKYAPKVHDTDLYDLYESVRVMIS